ncbi:MAG: helix-turn-helix domain-containing protein [bacterium]|jgi:hypothetical protein
MKTKTNQIKIHLLSGKSITSIEAFQMYNCTRLAAVIFNLKKSLDIKCERVKNNKVSYSKYSLK